MNICFHVHNFVFKVEIPKHELEHNEAAIEEEDRTQFEVDMVMFNNFCLIFGVPWHSKVSVWSLTPLSKIANDFQILFH